MEIKHLERGDRGAFVIRRDGDRVAEMTYVRAGEKMIIIDHTEVDESLRGQGIAEQLLEKAVAFARENNLKIRATCPYALRKLDGNEEYSDVYEG